MIFIGLYIFTKWLLLLSCFLLPFAYSEKLYLVEYGMVERMRGMGKRRERGERERREGGKGRPLQQLRF